MAASRHLKRKVASEALRSFILLISLWELGPARESQPVDGFQFPV